MVMMDEATANVDVASDEIIQFTIRSQFASATYSAEEFKEEFDVDGSFPSLLTPVLPARWCSRNACRDRRQP